MKTWTMQDVAAHWDATLDYDDINAKTDSYFRRFLDSSPLFTIPEHAKVLDIDCRTAKGTAYYHEKYPTAQFTCVAMSPLFQKLAREELERNKIQADVHIFESLPLPFPDASFDVVLTYETLEHVPWPETYIKELGRLTKTEGLLVLTTPSVLWEPIHWAAPKLGLHHSEGPHRMVPRKEILSAFAKAGFTVEQERSFVLVPGGPKFLVHFGKFLERIFPEWLKRILCLRRTFICRKHD
jgi:SAM-dependent methyltransferase